MRRRFIGIDNEPSYIEYAKGRIYNAKEGEPVNYLVGNSKHLSKEELNELQHEINHTYKKKHQKRIKLKLVKK